MRITVRNLKKIIKEELNKVLNETQQMSVYHGSPKSFDSFDPSRSNFRSLTYFTNNMQMGKTFAGGRGLNKGFLYTVSMPQLNLFDSADTKNLPIIKKIFLKLITQKYNDETTNMNYDPTNKTIFLNGQQIKNPTPEQFAEHLIWRLTNGSWRLLEGAEILKFLEAQGYDGLITRESSNLNYGVFPKALGKLKIINKEEIDVDPDL